MKQLFETERIRFVEASEELVFDYLRMVNDIEHVGRFIGRRTEPISEEKERSWVRGKLEEQAQLFSMIEKAGGEFIGNIELMDLKGTSAELGVSVTACKQEQGFGSEAIPAVLDFGFRKLGLSRISLKVYSCNTRAIHVYEKCGFTEYARTEDEVFIEILR